MKFYKYQGTGNDFVVVDNRLNRFSISNQDIAKICDRRFGIGADGFILLESHSTLDFNMVYFNSDGNESSMCGNGGRCIVAFAHDLGMFDTHCKFEAIDGMHEAILENEQVKLKMVDVTDIEIGKDYYFLNTGSPHYVSFVKDVANVKIIEEAHVIRYNDRFKEKGTNVNFVQLLGEQHIKVRTYERGVEDETLSCGTGVTAAAIASVLHTLGNAQGTFSITISSEGGELSVEFTISNGIVENIWLIGPAKFVFSGNIEL